ncbi:MAG: hypothetical protein ACREWG_11445 [Gammaproteobacteria bacterium]
MTVIQSLPLTVGLKPALTMVLDTLRRKHNLSDYTGADIDDVSVGACTAASRRTPGSMPTWSSLWTTAP